MTNYRDLFTALSAPFDKGEVKTRSQAGRTFSYVTARTIMNRLDAVLGPENWWDEYTPNGASVICRLSVRLPDGQVVTKADAGGEAGMADAGDNDKSGFSDAFKRAAVKFGVSRYLYRDGVATLTEPRPEPPAAQVPAPVPPAPTAPARAGSENAQGRGGKSVYGQARPKVASRPKTGEDLHYYAIECAIDPKLATWISNSFQPLGCPAKLVDWSPAQVTEAWPSIREHLLTVKQHAGNAKEARK